MHWSSCIYLPWNVSSFFMWLCLFSAGQRNEKANYWWVHVKQQISPCATAGQSEALWRALSCQTVSPTQEVREPEFLVVFLKISLQFICIREVTVMSSLPSDTVSCWSQVTKKPFLLGIRRFSHLPPPMPRRSWDLPTCTNGYSNLFVTSSCRTAHSHQHRYTRVQHYSYQFHSDSIWEIELL